MTAVQAWWGTPLIPGPWKDSRPAGLQGDPISKTEKIKEKQERKSACLQSKRT